MKAIQTKAELLKDEKPSLFKNGRDLVYSYDNPKIHQSAAEDLEKIGITQHDRAPLAEYSPDMHKVIEHVHSNFQRAFTKQLREDASIKTGKQYAQLMERVFFQLSQASIKRDVKSLKQTYEEIIKLGGGWPAKKYR